MTKHVFEMTFEEEVSIMTDGVEGKGAQARIQSLIRRAKAAEAALRERDNEHANAMDAVKKAHDKAVQDALAAQRSEADEDIALAGAGLADPTGRRLIREKWNTMDPKTRPATPSAYHKSILEQHAAHLADPKKPAPEVDAWHRGYLTPPKETKKISGPPPIDDKTPGGSLSVDDVFSAIGTPKGNSIFGGNLTP